MWFSVQIYMELASTNRRSGMIRADATGNWKSYKNPSYKKILSNVINESLSEAMISNIDWDKKIKFPLGLDDDEEEAKEGED